MFFYHEVHLYKMSTNWNTWDLAINRILTQNHAVLFPQQATRTSVTVNLSSRNDGSILSVFYKYGIGLTTENNMDYWLANHKHGDSAGG